jgi:hypothetical protein
MYSRKAQQCGFAIKKNVVAKRFEQLRNFDRPQNRRSPDPKAKRPVRVDAEIASASNRPRNSGKARHTEVARVDAQSPKSRVTCGHVR